MGHLKFVYPDILLRVSYILARVQMLYNLGPNISSMQQRAKKYQTGELEHTHAVGRQAFKQLENMCEPHKIHYVRVCVLSDSRQGSVSIECVQRQGFISLFH
jgi:hypothetical protein